MRKFLAFGVCAGLLAGCANLSAINRAVNTPVASSTAIDEKVMYSGEQTYNLLAKTYLDLNSKGLITGDTKASLKLKVQTAKKYLDGMRTAKAALDAKTFTDKYHALLSVKAEFCTLTGKACT